jgi:hypothetical protein
MPHWVWSGSLYQPISGEQLRADGPLGLVVASADELPGCTGLALVGRLDREPALLRGLR